MAMVSVPSLGRASQDQQRIGVKVPIVTAVGCAAPTGEPHIWALTRAGDPTPSSTTGITSQEKQELQKRPMGRGIFQLIGVADFVDREQAQAIGSRAKLFPPARMNTTAQLIDGHKVAVRGLYIEGKPARVNLTSVLDLGPECER
jgi:hypothetical protein